MRKDIDKSVKIRYNKHGLVLDGCYETAFMGQYKIKVNKIVQSRNVCVSLYATKCRRDGELSVGRRPKRSRYTFRIPLYAVRRLPCKHLVLQ